jgi:hypothetical protein
MRMILVPIVLLQALLAGEDAGPTSSPTSRSITPVAPSPQEIPRLIDLLGHPRFSTRRQAAEQLKLVPEQQLTDPLAAAFRSTKDHEVRLLIREVAQTAFLKEYEEGFLGVQLDPQPVTSSQEPRLRDKAVGIKVVHAVPGTAAGQAGLRAGDVIAGCDGQPVPPGPENDASKGFRDMISRKKPHSRIRLDVLRGYEAIAVNVTLSGRPERPENYWVPGKQEELQGIEKSLQAWWRKHFEDPSPTSLPASDRN